MNEQDMIQVDKVTKEFGTVRAVCDLTLRIPRGQLYCFLGPNGAGKTTTIKMMTGLLRPTRGAVRIGGVDLREDPVAAKKMTGFIPDFPFLYERLTTVEFFQFTGDLYGLSRGRVDDELEQAFLLFGLDDYRKSLIKDLSHGYRQRLAYASTFLHNPDVLFVDEPFVGLDPYTIRLIKDLLRRRAREGMTIFMTTHILALIEDLADRIGIIVNGRLAAEGTLGELVTQTRIEEGSLEDVFFSLAK